MNKKKKTGYDDSADLRKRAEEAREWQATFDAVSDAICLLDADQRILRCNRVMTEMFGVTQEELIGRHCWEVVHGATEPIPECPITRMKSSLHREEMEMQRGDRSFNVIADPILDETRTIRGGVHIVRDITERKRAEEVLRESEEKYRNLVERANDGIVIVQDGIVKYINARLAEMRGVTVEEVIGTPFTDHIYPDELPEVVDRYKQRMAGEDVSPIYETALRRRDGSKIHAELNAGMVTYQGKPADIVIIRDITERKRAEEVLRYQAVLLTNTYDAIIASDEHYRLTAWNAAAESLYGWKAEEVLGRLGLDVAQTEFPGVEKSEMLRTITEIGY